MGYQDHDQCETPPDDTVVWRYMSFLKFVDLLENSRLWFTRVDRLGDPREGALTELQLQQLQKAGPEVAEHNRSVLESERRETFVNCWTESRESMAMWDLYAAAPGGVAISSTIGKLKLAVSDAAQTIFIARVKYEAATTVPNNLIAMYVRKDWGFVHEGEVRLIAWLPGSSTPTDREAGAPVSLLNAIRPSLQGWEKSDQETWGRTFKGLWDKACLERAQLYLSVEVDVSGLIDEIIIGPRSAGWKGLVDSVFRRYGMDGSVVRESELTFSRDSGVA